MPTPESDVPYLVEEVVDWDPSSFTVRRDADGVTISGSCPLCDHEVVKRLRATGIYGFGRDAAEADPDEDVIRCNCRHEHAGGKVGDGCGRYWGVEIQRR
jgi:hypothetical protein